MTTERRRDLADLLAAWTALGARLAGGLSSSSADGGEAAGLGPAQLTVNFGFGPGLFGVGGPDRFGLAALRPMELIDLPAFAHDDLAESTTGGDLSVHACADDPQVVFHAVRQLAREAAGVASIRWTQSGFNETAASAGTPRNLFGSKRTERSTRKAPPNWPGRSGLVKRGPDG